MGKSTTYATNLLKLILQNIALSNYGDASGIQPSATAGSYYPVLFTGDPGTSDDATVNEANYTGYTRAPGIVRSAAGFTVASGSGSNAALVSFPACTGGSNLITHWGLATASSGAAHLPYSAPLISAYFDCVGVTSGNLFTAPGHTLSVNDPIQFINAPGGTMVGGVSTGTTYYVKTVSSDTFTISATLGGSTLTVSSDGSAIVGKISTLSVSNGITPQFAIGQLVVTES
jgi:hypothetical protein